MHEVGVSQPAINLTSVLISLQPLILAVLNASRDGGAHFKDSDEHGLRGVTAD